MVGRGRDKSILICSREAEETYGWLIKCLHNLKKERKIIPVYISSNFSDFCANIPKTCKCVILYHSKKRGRLNITDVNDSLYDQELRHLSKKYKKKRVIVLIDDVDDSSDAGKGRILQSQKTITETANDTFLFSGNDKETRQDGSFKHDSKGSKIHALIKAVEKKRGR